jgi:dolichol-phosphate mannosyltransferase
MTTDQKKGRKVYIVLPCYNEESRLGKLLDRIDEAMADASLLYQIIIIDDGSTDKTASIVNDYVNRIPITLKHHEVNQGLGATIRDGLMAAAAAANLRDIIVTMDADDTHTPGLVLRMVRMIGEGHDVVIASRYRSGSRTIGVQLYRRLLSYGGSLLLRLFFPIRGVKDYTCGYRAYRAAVLQEAIQQFGKNFLDQEGFHCMVDILLKLYRMNLVFGEVPMVLRYDLKQGESKMNVRRTIVNTLQLIIKRRFNR